MLALAFRIETSRSQSVIYGNGLRSGPLAYGLAAEPIL
jgi:hypothetical protein